MKRTLDLTSLHPASSASFIALPRLTKRKFTYIKQIDREDVTVHSREKRGAMVNAPGVRNSRGPTSERILSSLRAAMEDLLHWAKPPYDVNLCR
jgi:hypothetical protein